MQTLPLSNAGNTAWKVRRPQGWVFTTTVVQFGGKFLPCSELHQKAEGLPGNFQAFAAQLLQCLPSPLGFGCWESSPSAASFIISLALPLLLSVPLFGDHYSLKQVLRLQWPLKPLEILAKIFLGLCLGYSDSVRRDASLKSPADDISTIAL